MQRAVVVKLGHNQRHLRLTLTMWAWLFCLNTLVVFTASPCKPCGQGGVNSSSGEKLHRVLPAALDRKFRAKNLGMYPSRTFVPSLP